MAWGTPVDFNPFEDDTNETISRKNLQAAQQELGLTPQEQALYERHLGNLYGPGGVDNPDGSRSSLYQTTVTLDDGKAYTIPTVWDGKILPPREAMDRANQEGWGSFPSYPSVDEAEQRYQKLHGYMEKDTGDYLASRSVPRAPAYDPFTAFGQSPQPAQAPQGPGVFGQSFGMLSPQEQQADLDARFADFNAKQQQIAQLERMRDLPVNQSRRAAIQSQIDARTAALPDLDQLQLMQAGDRPLATKTALRSGVENAAQGFGTGLLSVPEYAGIVKGYIGSGKVDDDSLLQWAQGAKQYVANLFPGDAARADDFSQKLAYGLGQIATFYGTGAAAALAKLGPKATMAILAGMGSAQLGSGGFEEGTAELARARADAAAAGDTASVTEYDRLLKTLGYSGVGAALAFPIARGVSGASEAATLPGRVAQGALEQGATLAGAQAEMNSITQNTTDPNRSIGEGVPEAAATGGIFGGLFNAFGRRRQQPSPGSIDRGQIYEAAPRGTLRLESPGEPMEPVFGRSGPGADNSPTGAAPAPEPPNKPQGPGGYTEPPMTPAKRDALYGKIDESKPVTRDSRPAPQLDLREQRAALQQEVTKQLSASPRDAARAEELLAQFDPSSGASPVIDAAAQRLMDTGKLSRVAQDLIKQIKAAPPVPTPAPEQFGGTMDAASVRTMPRAGVRPEELARGARPTASAQAPTMEAPPRGSISTGDIMSALAPTEKQDLRNNLQQFIDGGHRNDWINADGYKLYVRKAQRINPATEQPVPALDLASVEIAENRRGQGDFKDMVEVAKDVARQNGLQGIYVENVLTDQFANYFRNAPGWEQDKSIPWGPPSFFLPLEPEPQRPNVRDAMSALAPRGAPAPERDALGYYSKALEAAKALPQAKGTPEQITATLRNAGVKDAEIAATGLGKFLAGKLEQGVKQVTKQEVVDFLAQNRVTLQESTYGGPVPDTRALERREQELNRSLWPEGNLGGRSRDEVTDELEQVRNELNRLSVDYKNPKWEQYSLDNGNPTYEEKVLHLGGSWTAYNHFTDDLRKKYGEGGFDNLPLTSTERATLDRLQAQAAEPEWKSGHWSEPNIIAHQRTQELMTTDGRRSLNLDELQSDEGQAIREQGSVNPEEADAKIAGLQQRFDQMVAEKSSPLAVVYDIANKYDPGLAKRALDNGRLMSGHYVLGSDYYGFEPQIKEYLRANYPNFVALERELAAAQAQMAAYASSDHEAAFNSVLQAERTRDRFYTNLMENDPAHLLLSELSQATYARQTMRAGHPLINTTDQWVETAMRRLIQRAADAGVDGISITPGKVQNERYRLSNAIDAIDMDFNGTKPGDRRVEFYKDGGRQLWAIVDADGKMWASNNQGLIGHPLSAAVGVDVAKQIMEAKEPRRFNVAEMEVGGQGMKATYDSIYPRTLLKLVQKLDKNTKPERVKLVAHSFDPNRSKPRNYHEWAQGTNFENEFIFIPLSDKAKEALAEKAQPMFALAPKSGPKLAAVHNLGSDNLAFADRMGGIAVPSVAVVKEGMGMEGFGDISLIAKKDLADPAKNPVFDSDAYSPRFPQPNYRPVSVKLAQPLINRITQFNQSTNDHTTSSNMWDAMVNRPNPDDLVRTALRGSSAKAAYLSTLGIAVEPVRDQTPDRGGFVDRWATEAEIDKAMIGHEADFRKWIDDVFIASFGEPRLKLGRKWVPYTLDNIVTSMTTGRTNGRESGLTVSEGQARAMAAKRFRSVEQMRKAASPEGAMLNGEELEQARKVAQDLMSNWRDAAVPFYTGRTWRGEIDIWDALDASMRAVAKVAANRSGPSAAALDRAMRAEGFKDVPPEVLDQGLLGINAFMAAPVPYFESKPQRAVGLEEFAGAVIPANASDETKAILEKHGIPYRTYDTSRDGEGRTAQARATNKFIKELSASGEEALFALKGFYSPAIRAAEKVKQDKATPEQWWKMISTAPGVRQEELQLMGLKPWLDEQGSLMEHRPGSNLPPSMRTLPREAVIDFMRENELAVDTTLFVSEGTPEWQAEQQRIADEENARRMAEWERRRAEGLPPEPEPEEDEEDQDDPYEGMVSDYDRQTAISARADELFEELEMAAIDNLASEWDYANDPDRFSIEIESDLDAEQQEIYDNAKAALDLVLLTYGDQLNLPGIAPKPRPTIKDFLPDDFPDDAFYFSIDKPDDSEDGDYKSDNDGQYFRTREAAEDAAEAWMEDYRDSFEELQQNARDNFYQGDFAHERGEAQQQAEEEWDNDNPDWVPEDAREVNAEQAERNRARQREQALRDLNTPPDPIQPRRFADTTKFGTYKIKGGEHYSEMLVQLPILEKAGYDSHHYHSNEVVHIRFDTRTGPDGERVIFIHEIQSDLHQRARGFGFGSEGYAKAKSAYAKMGYTPEMTSERAQLIAEQDRFSEQARKLRDPFTGAVSEADQAAWEALVAKVGEAGQARSKIEQQADKTYNAASRYLSTFGGKGAPAAPFTGDGWWQLAVKMMFRHAMESGASAIALTDPEQISAATYTPKAVAEKFYGENVPRFIDKYVKQWGAKREEKPVSGTTGKSEMRLRPDVTPDAVIAFFETMADVSRAAQQPETATAASDFVAMLRDPLFDFDADILQAIADDPIARWWASNGVYDPRTGRHIQSLLHDVVVTKPQPYWPITEKMRATKETENGFEQPLFAKEQALRQELLARLKMGQAINAPDPDRVLDALKPAMGIVPDGATVGALTRLEPDPTAPGFVTATFRDPKGELFEVSLPFDNALRNRAVFATFKNDDGTLDPRLFILNLSGAARSDKGFSGELWHEGVHALRELDRFPGRIWRRLLDHANNLHVMDIELLHYLRFIGVPVPPEDEEANLISLNDIYTDLYSHRRRFSEQMDQESVAHMLELYHHGGLTPEEMAPVQDIVDAMARGDFSRGSAAAAKTRTYMSLQALQPVGKTGEPIINDPAFKAWFGDSQVVDSKGDPKIVYHGTLADIETFDLKRSSASSNVGRGLYFTDSPKDAGANYGRHEGPDTRGKIDEIVDHLMDIDPGLSHGKATEVALKRLRYSHFGATMPVYLKIENPVMISDNPREATQFTYEYPEDENGDFSGAETGTLLDFIDAVRQVAPDFNDVDDLDSFISEIAMEAQDNGGQISYGRILDIATGSPIAFAEEPTSGQLAIAELIRRAAETMGYDGIIDKSVATKFPRLPHIKGTTHYIAFKPTQVKAVFNRGGFDPKDPNILSAFAGIGADTADVGAALEAREMEKAGMGSWEIWEHTGWTRGLEGDWKFEIDDSGSSWKQTAEEIATNAKNATEFQLGDLLDHPKLFQAYPSLKRLGVKFRQSMPFENGSYDPTNRLITLGIGAFNVKPEGATESRAYPGLTDTPEDLDKLKSTLLHEIQHTIQQKENFAWGSNVAVESTNFLERLTRNELTDRDHAVMKHLTLLPLLNRYENAVAVMAKTDPNSPLGKEMLDTSSKTLMELSKKMGIALYRRSAGENEARVVQRRRDYTERGRRDNPPNFAADYPDKQIVASRYAGDMPVSQRYTAYLKDAQKRGEKPISFKQFKEEFADESV